MNRNILYSYRRLLHLCRSRRPYSSKVEPEINENEPIKFSTSRANRRVIVPIMRTQNKEVAPWYQMYSVLGSVVVFLVYFCLLREENDVDLELTKSLYDRIKGLEKEQLLLSYKFNKENGLSVADIERRLKEIEAEEAAEAKS